MLAKGHHHIAALQTCAGRGLAVGGAVNAHSLAVVEVVGHDAERHLKSRGVAGAALGFGERNLGAAVQLAQHCFDQVHHLGEAVEVDLVGVVAGLVVVRVLPGEQVQHRHVGQVKRRVVRGAHAARVDFQAEFFAGSRRRQGFGPGGRGSDPIEGQLAGGAQATHHVHIDHGGGLDRQCGQLFGEVV